MTYRYADVWSRRMRVNGLAKVLTTAALLVSIGIHAQSDTHDTLARTASPSVQHLQDFEVIELRRYVTKDGERERFVRYFETWFPEAFEQLGSIVFGEFTERDSSTRFTWLRGFKDLGARAIVSSAFYYGPVWKEHRAELNAILPDSDNVLLLQPVHAGKGIPVLPSVDPVSEPNGMSGVVAAEIFAVNKGSESSFAARIEPLLMRCASADVRSAGFLVSLDVPNNFPQLPIRTDGPFVVWLAIAKDGPTVTGHLIPCLDGVDKAAGRDMLHAPIERILLDPASRSRLRWLPAMAAKQSP